MTLAELLKSANVADDVIAGLPKEVSTTLEGYVSDADTKLKTAAEKATEAQEALRLVGLERADINKTVEDYAGTLTKMSDATAKLAAFQEYAKTLKEQGFEVPAALLPGDGGVKPVVPGSPPIGGNALDEGKLISKLRGEVGSVFSQYIDANNEHIRLFGSPIPESSESIALEAARARRSVGDFIADKYKFAEKRATKEQEAFQKRVDDAVKAKVDETLRLEAEKRGSNPNLRPGEPSRSSFVPKIKGEEFHKSDGNVPTRERHQRLLTKVHADVEAARANA